MTLLRFQIRNGPTIDATERVNPAPVTLAFARAASRGDHRSQRRKIPRSVIDDLRREMLQVIEAAADAVLES